MGFRLKLFGFAVFLLLTLSFCQAKNVTVRVIGAIHCTDCIRREFSNSQASLGVDVVISCKSKNRETKTQGNSAIDKQGKFNVTLSAEIKEDGSSIEGCLAKLQTASSSAPCPIQSAQTATMELLTTNENATQASHNRPTTVIQFSPLTCQSAFFWPMPNLTFFPATPPPPEQPVDDAPPPSEAFSPVEPPLAPVEDSTPPPAPASEPSYLPEVPSLPPTLSAPAPETGTSPPTPAPASPQSPPIYSTPPPLPPLNMPIPPPNPKFQKPIPPPLPKPPPYKPTPILPPIPPKKHKIPHIKTPIAPPPEIPNPPPQLPKHEKPAAAPSPIGISTPPSEGKPSSIPRAPPVPRLPPIPQVPRKYFNAPKSKSKPPHSF